jgi:phosphoribosyl 1,2-cyclic phosphodiesterase
VVLDVGPDVFDALAECSVTRVDAFFLTHFHRDHADGLLSLLGALRKRSSNAVEGPVDPEEYDPAGPHQAFDLFATDTAVEHLRETFAYHLDVLEPTSPDGGVDVGDCWVESFGVEHIDGFDTRGFVVDDGTATVAYAPDMSGFVEDPPEADVDLFVCEGSPIVGHAGHGPRERLLTAVDAVDADRTVLVNATEHAARAHTKELVERAEAVGCDLGTDLAVYRLSDSSHD